MSHLSKSEKISLQGEEFNIGGPCPKEKNSSNEESKLNVSYKLSILRSNLREGLY